MVLTEFYDDGKADTWRWIIIEARQVNGVYLLRDAVSFVDKLNCWISVEVSS